jgi:hypothetical protein
LKLMPRRVAPRTDKTLDINDSCNRRRGDSKPYARSPIVRINPGLCEPLFLGCSPHWDYPIRSSSINPAAAARMKYDGALFADLFTIGGDAALGIVVAVIFFNAQTLTSYLLALGGACAGMLPDALQFAYIVFRANH